DAFEKGHTDLGAQLAVMNRRLAYLEGRLGATPEEVAAAAEVTTTPGSANGPEAEGGLGGSTS
ncbi:MAG: hypothetical protein ACRDV4_03845, partial [Acidimicrobiales bacterium]